MTPKSTDIKKISRYKCETEGCPNKAAGILKKKFACKECFNRKKHRKIISQREYYLNFLKSRVAAL